MEEQIVTIYCLCDEFLRGIQHHEDPQCRMSDAEVLTTAIVASLYFGGNLEHARLLLKSPSYIPNMLSKSRLNRRLHRIAHLVTQLFYVLAEIWKATNQEGVYCLDTFPIPVCDNIRISRARIYRDKAFRGYIPSKRSYFYGLKIHLLVTQSGRPVEFFLTPGSVPDVKGLERFQFDLPAGAVVLGDKAYNHYLIEDLLAEVGIKLSPYRKKNSKRPVPPWWAYLQHQYRKIVETAGSLITQMLPKSIHAVTPAGFELKVALFVLALSIRPILG